MEYFLGNHKLQKPIQEKEISLEIFEKVMKIHPLQKNGANDVLFLLRM